MKGSTSILFLMLVPVSALAQNEPVQGIFPPDQERRAQPVQGLLDDQATKQSAPTRGQMPEPPARTEERRQQPTRQTIRVRQERIVLIHDPWLCTVSRARQITYVERERVQRPPVEYVQRTFTDDRPPQVRAMARLKSASRYLENGLAGDAYDSWLEAARYEDTDAGMQARTLLAAFPQYANGRRSEGGATSTWHPVAASRTVSQKDPASGSRF
jgi:hypothetical protein